MDKLNGTLKSIKPIDMECVSEAQKRLDSLVKPIGSLGKLEDMAARMAGITGKIKNKISKKTIVVMCSDNGVVDEGVSSAPQFLTALMTNNFTKGITGVCVLAKNAGSDLTIVDIGVKGELKHPKIIDKKIAHGTRNMAKEVAMTREEAISAIEAGIEIVDRLVAEGYDLIGTGEMGIGNTATSSAVVSVLSGIEVAKVSGKGAGLSEEQFEKKIKTIERAIEINRPNKNDVIDVISKVGGFDIAGMCGCFLGAAKNRVPIVIDGFISSVAALCAYRLNPDTKGYMYTSHLSAEPGAIFAAREIGLEPILNLGMRLGEGTGCPLAFNIIEAALYTMNNMATLEESTVASDFLVDIR